MTQLSADAIERRWEARHLTLKDWIQILLLAGALLAQYIAMDRRLTVVETKIDLIYSGHVSGK